MTTPIRVGIIGTGGWARYGHIPVLQAMDAFEVVALAGRNLEKVRMYAGEFGIPDAFGSPEELIADPRVDLVVVLAPTPQHGPLARMAIDAGKDVYVEWPLSTSTAESKELLEFAKARGVRHVVGLQRRFSPSSRYWHDLVSGGYIGRMRGVRMSVGVDAFGSTMPDFARWAVDANNFTHVLSIYGGHFGDMLFSGVGFPETVLAVTETQLPVTTLADSGEQIPYTAPNEVMATGSLIGGGLYAIQLEGGQQRRTGLQIDITGTEGVLRITNARGFENTDDNAVLGMRGHEDTLRALPVPDSYATLPVAHLDASTRDVAYLYAAYAFDREHGTSTATGFEDAIRQHEIIDAVTRSASRPPAAFSVI